MGTLETDTLSFSAKGDAHFSEDWQVTLFFVRRVRPFFLPVSSLAAAF